jgi:hypothetical protein
MQVDEITRNAFLSPLFNVQDIPVYDEDGEYNLDEDDFWNIYNPDELHIPEEDRKDLLQCRQNTRDAAEVYKQDVEAFLECVPDERTLKSAMDMVSSRGDFEAFYATCLERSETLALIAKLEQQITSMEPLAKEHPELKAAVASLKQDIKKYKEKIKLPKHGDIQKWYDFCKETFEEKSQLKIKFPYSLSAFTNYWNGKNPPERFPRKRKGIPGKVNAIDERENPLCWRKWLETVYPKIKRRKS